MLYTLPAFAAISLLAAESQAWGMQVHNQIAFMAEEFLKPETKDVVGQLLEPEYKGSIGRAAAWPDIYSHTDEGAYTAQWHYIDPADNVGTFK